MKDVDNPPELQCFGFNLTNMDVHINKGYIQLNSNYIKIDRSQLSELRQEFCQALEGTLRSSPERFQDMLGHYIPGLSHLKSTNDAFSSEKELKKRIKKSENPNFETSDEKMERLQKERGPQINYPEDVVEELTQEEEEERKIKNKYKRHADQNTAGIEGDL